MIEMITSASNSSLNSSKTAYAGIVANGFTLEVGSTLHNFGFIKIQIICPEKIAFIGILKNPVSRRD
jgi:hypothetical protein